MPQQIQFEAIREESLLDVEAPRRVEFAIDTVVCEFSAKHCDNTGRAPVAQWIERPPPKR